jgi:hypothetical protein
MADRCRPFVSRLARSCSRARRLSVDEGVVNADRLQDNGCRSLNPSERLRERSGIAAIQVDVVAGRVGDVEAKCVSNHERDCFGFELACVTRAGTVFAVMQQLVRLCTASGYVRLSLVTGLPRRQHL